MQTNYIKPKKKKIGEVGAFVLGYIITMIVISVLLAITSLSIYGTFVLFINYGDVIIYATTTVIILLLALALIEPLKKQINGSN